MPRERKIETREQDARALDLRRRGLTYAQIAENLGFASTNASFQSVKRAIKDLYQEDTEGQTTLELERLDDMLRVLVRVALSKHAGVDWPSPSRPRSSELAATTRPRPSPRATAPPIR